LYGGSREHLGAVPLVALTFYASLWTIKYGQNTGLLLFGLAGFAFFNQRNRPVLAGACAALTALKPHLLALFRVLLIVNLMPPRGLTPLIAGVAMIALGLVVAIVVDPSISTKSRAALENADAHGAAKPLSGWVLPQAAFHIRVAIDPTRFWIQFVPCA